MAGFGEVASVEEEKMSETLVELLYINRCLLPVPSICKHTPAPCLSSHQLRETCQDWRSSSPSAAGDAPRLEEQERAGEAENDPAQQEEQEEPEEQLTSAAGDVPRAKSGGASYPR